MKNKNYKMSQCKGTTKGNVQCSRKVKTGSEFCSQHGTASSSATSGTEPSTKPTAKSSKPPKEEMNLDFDVEKFEIDIVNINETTNMIVLMNSVMKLVKHIEEINPKFDFGKYLTTTEYKALKKALHKFICNERRVYLIIDYAFLNGYRSLMEPFSFYGVNFLTDDEKRIFYSFLPRGYTGTVPKRDNFGESSTPFSASSHSSFFTGKSKTSGTSKEKTSGTSKTSKEEEPPKTSSTSKEGKKTYSVPPKEEPKPSTTSKTPKEEPKTSRTSSTSELTLAKVLEEIKKIMPDKNAATYIKLIMTSTNDLIYTRKEIMDLFREFHPDKAGTDPKAVQLCTLVSSKISLLKKKLDSSSSPTRPIGNLFLDVCKILNH